VSDNSIVYDRRCFVRGRSFTLDSHPPGTARGGLPSSGKIDNENLVKLAINETALRGHVDSIPLNSKINFRWTLATDL
jgi:hypothetical protein